MRALHDLLTTWETWSARDTLKRALDRATTDDHRQKVHQAIADTPPVDPLDALRDSAELVALLTGWQWQAVYAARRDGASWHEVATATGVTVEQARTDYAAAIERQERHGISDVRANRDVL